jgi:hypothetical protein
MTMAMTIEELEAMSEEELDELVIETKCQEASSINNQGRDAQIEYLRNELIVTGSRVDEKIDEAEYLLGDR